MSRSCARAIEGKRAKKEVLGASGSTGAYRSRRRQWRQREFDLEQPVGGEARVLGADERGDQGVYMDTIRRNNLHENRSDRSRAKSFDFSGWKLKIDYVSLHHRGARLTERGRERGARAGMVLGC